MAVKVKFNSSTGKVSYNSVTGKVAITPVLDCRDGCPAFGDTITLRFSGWKRCSDSADLADLDVVMPLFSSTGEFCMWKQTAAIPGLSGLNTFMFSVHYAGSSRIWVRGIQSSDAFETQYAFDCAGPWNNQYLITSCNVRIRAYDGTATRIA